MKKDFHLSILFIVIICFYGLNGCNKSDSTVTKTSVSATPLTLFVHCAAGMRKPVEKMAVEFQNRTGYVIEFSYAGTNTLLGQIKVTEKGDVYIAGDADYIEMAKEEFLIERDEILCYFVPVIMVKKGNPNQIKSLNDLLREGIRIGQADEKAAAIGRLTPEIVAMNGISQKDWNTHVRLSTGTVNELGIAIELGTLDAAIVWSSIAINYIEKAEMIIIPRSKNIIPKVGAAVLSFSEHKKEAGELLSFLVSDYSKRILENEGYVVDLENLEQF
ncbi:MAG: substrate-binding domain-containing protein [Spirochaetales bacterium]|nr:substrate-binding domain-containing protein [Spirochaetales bacterium]